MSKSNKKKEFKKELKKLKKKVSKEKAIVKKCMTSSDGDDFCFGCDCDCDCDDVLYELKLQYWAVKKVYKKLYK